MVDLGLYRARIGCFVDRGSRPRSKMDPFRHRYRLSTRGEFLICLSLLFAWGLLIRCCLDTEKARATTGSLSGSLGNCREDFRAKKIWGWEGLAVMTSRSQSATTSVPWGWRGVVKVVIRRHASLEEIASTSPVEEFPFSTIPCDGDIHPHPGPSTPTTLTSTTPSVPQTPLVHSTTASVSRLSTTTTTTASWQQHQQPTPVNFASQESTSLPLLRPARLRHDQGTQSSPQMMTSSRGQPIGGEVTGLESRVTTQQWQSGGPPGFPTLDISSVDTSTSTSFSMKGSVYSLWAPTTSTQVPQSQTQPHLRHDANHPHHDGQPTLTSDSALANQNADFGDLSAIAGTWDSIPASSSVPAHQSQESLFITEHENECFEQALESFPPRQLNNAKNSADNQVWTQSQNSTSLGARVGSSSVDDDAMYGRRPESYGISQEGGSELVGGVSGLSEMSVVVDPSIPTGESVGKMNERGRSISSSDLDSMDPILLGIRQQASQTSQSITPHPSLGNPPSGDFNPPGGANPQYPHLSNTTKQNQTQAHLQGDKDNDTGMTEMKEQMTSIFQELRNITKELQSSRSNTQKALDDAKLDTKKTHQAINHTQSAVDKLHAEFKTTQDRTQQALHDTHKNITAVQKQVNHSLLSLQEIKKELTETITKVETSTEGIKANRADIQTNRDNIQQLKDELKGIKEKQTELTEQQNDMEDQNARVDRHMDRQEVINRRSNIVFFGVLEGQGRRRENTEEIVIDVLQTFMPDGDWQHSDCVTAYRAGRRDDSRADSGREEDRQARPIIATLDRPSDVGFILRHREGREEMRKSGLSCAQDLSRTQQQKIRDIKSEGKQAYYFKGRLVVKDNPYNRLRDNRLRSNNRDDRRNTQDNRYDRRGERLNPNYNIRQNARRELLSTIQDRRKTRSGRTDQFAQKTRLDKMVQTSENGGNTNSGTVAPTVAPTDSLTVNDQPTQRNLTGSQKPVAINQAANQEQQTDKEQGETAECESVEGSQGNYTDTSGRTSQYTYERSDRPRYRRGNPRTQYDFFACQGQQQFHSEIRYGNRRQPSGDRRNSRNSRSSTQQQQQQWYAHTNDPNANYFGSNSRSHGQPSFSANPPPSFLQAPYLQHLANQPGMYMPPPPPVRPPTVPPHFYPPHSINNQGGTHEMSGNQWSNMWQRGDPARSWNEATERWNERGQMGQWTNDARARRMRGQQAWVDSGTRGNEMSDRGTSRASKHQPELTGTDTGLAQSVQNEVTVQEDECVCGCESIKKKKTNKVQSKSLSHSHIVIEDSDEKSQPDTEESEYEECAESVLSSEEEGESDGNKRKNVKSDSDCKVKVTTKARIPGSYFGAHSLYDTAKVIDITDRVVQARNEPMKETEQILDIQGGNFAAKEKVTLPDPIHQITDPIQPIPEVIPQLEMVLDESSAVTDVPYTLSQSMTDISGAGQKVTICAQVHVDDKTIPEANQTGPVMNEQAKQLTTDNASHDVTSEGEGKSQAKAKITDQSLESLARQVLEANERAAAREGGKVASDVGDTDITRESGSTPAVRRLAKQTLLSPTGQLITAQASEESDWSESEKQKPKKQRGKKKKAKIKKKTVDQATKKPDSQGELDGPTTRSKSQTNSN